MNWGGFVNSWASAWREDLAGRLQEEVARGHHTFEALCTAVSDPVPDVAEALAWAVSEGLLTHAVRPAGDWFELTPHGAATLAFRQSIQRATRSDGEVDLGDVACDLAVAEQVAQSARQRQQAHNEAHLLVGTAEREAAVSLLEEHYARGTFDLDELERRTTLAMAARTRGDLAVATADLGWTTSQPASGHAALPPMATTIASGSGPLERRSEAALIGKFQLVFWIVFAAGLLYFGLLKALMAVAKGLAP